MIFADGTCQLKRKWPWDYPDVCPLRNPDWRHELETIIRDKEWRRRDAKLMGDD
jgi:hypothetical protein